MARQATTPVQFTRSTRGDNTVIMTSGRAGVVTPLAYVPLLRGDSASGRIGIDLDLAEMPRPLQNGVMANFQAWFVPKSCHPQFAGLDEFMHSYQQTPQDVLVGAGRSTRNPVPFFNVVTDEVSLNAIRASAFIKTLGIHLPPGTPFQTDLLDAFWLAYNFRLAAHSSRLPLAPFAAQDLAAALQLPRAFWPSGRFSRVVPDYEQALIMGSLDLDIIAGSVPIPGIRRVPNIDGIAATATMRGTGPSGPGTTGSVIFKQAGQTGGIEFDLIAGQAMTAALAGGNIGTSLRDIDAARTTQAFAKLRAAYAGNDTTGFDNDDTIVATLMQGLHVPEDQFRRPWLLDSARVAVGFAERFATDGPSLDKSVTQGRASATLSLNVPVSDSGGTIIVTCEVLPERIDERQSDEWLHKGNPLDLPDALRDVQRPEPVDLVVNRRLDALHAQPDALYGYEPMNDQWDRASTRLGGAFYQDNPANPWTEQRSAIWQTSIVNPTFTKDHWLAPSPFPHSVFADASAPAFEVVARHSLSIVGLTQIGDPLHENNGDFETVEAVAE